ncbi:Protein CBG08893 [Caenorhabditis briggsae]|uniref:Protein CBG08893 n=2 Tax=Caenorhabditis briggsae TaxID=6238 RepID=A8X7M5_CAEBR|nr:Protein CBG08893 [Caenorhabditis briggsae]ULT85259.1 hypothetical protein L3Y34_013798 [Caenorhabditis briggsae]CAP28636.1 Protein CBG08893 [Caenorhabditis briggsae]
MDPRKRRFPILRVDNLVFRKIISNIAPYDLVSFAQSSRRYQRVIKANKSIFQHLNIAIICHENNPAGLELSFIDYSGEDDESEHSDDENDENQDLHTKTEIGEKKPMSTEASILYFDFFVDLLIKDNIISYVSIFDWTGDLIKIFDWISTRQESVKQFELYMNHIKDSDLNHFFAIVKVTDKLEMNVLPSLEYRAQCYQQLDTIDCQNVFWWRLEHFLMFDCKKIMLEDTHLTNDNIVWLLECWLDGSGLKILKNMAIDGNNLNRSIIVSKVKHILLDRKAISAMSGSVITEIANGGAVIERSDGVKAVIPFIQPGRVPIRQFELYVLDKPNKHE